MVEKSQLNWDRLKEVDLRTPWRTLEEFSHALSTDPGMWNDLAKVYDDYYLDEVPHSFECLYVPAIFALAASRLAPDARIEIGRFLIRALVEADHREECDFIIEALSNAAHAMGPVILPDVLETLIAEMKPPRGPSFELWNLTTLAMDETNPFLRRQTIDLCRQTVQRAADGELDVELIGSAAWTLAKLKVVEARPLLKQLAEQTEDMEIEDALDEMDGVGEADEDDKEFSVPNWLDEVRNDLCEFYVERDDGGPSDEDEEWDEDFDDEYDDEEDEEFDEDLEPGDEPIINSGPKVGLNDPCPCGSGKKYKKCCGKPR